VQCQQPHAHDWPFLFSLDIPTKRRSTQSSARKKQQQVRSTSSELRVICFVVCLAWFKALPGARSPHYRSNQQILRKQLLCVGAFERLPVRLHRVLRRFDNVRSRHFRTPPMNRVIVWDRWKCLRGQFKPSFIFGHRPKLFLNDRKKLSQFGQNVRRYRLVNIVAASFNTLTRQMTQMSAKKKTSASRPCCSCFCCRRSVVSPDQQRPVFARIINSYEIFVGSLWFKPYF